MIAQKEKEILIEFSKFLKKIKVTKLERVWHCYYNFDFYDFLARKIFEKYKKESLIKASLILVRDAVEIIERERVERGRSLVYADDLRELEWHFGVRYNDILYLHFVRHGNSKTTVEEAILSIKNY